MVRLDRNSKKSYKKIEIALIAVLIILLIMTLIFSIKKTAFAQASGSSIVIEQSTNTVISGNNIHTKLPMASTTKIATAITAIESIDINSKVKIPKAAVGVEGSSIYLQDGDIYTIKDLLCGLMLQSGNDSAVALALLYGNGEMAQFLDKMNALAVKIGAVNTNFKNPHGLHHKDHYTTAFDLAIITAYAFKNETFKEIIAMKTASISDGKGGARVISNKNKMLKEFDGGNGVKTGYTKVAGKCLVSAAKRDNLQLISVVINHPNMWGDSKAMLENGFDNYKAIKIASAGQSIADISFKGGSKSVALKEDIYLPIKKDLARLPNLKFSIQRKVARSFLPETGQYVADLKLYIDNHLIFIAKTYTM